MIFPPKVFPRRWRGTMSCHPRVGTPALGRLWRTRPQLVAVYSTARACQPLSVHIYGLPHLLSKSGSQVDDYPIFIYKEPSAFPTAHCDRNQAVQAAEPGGRSQSRSGSRRGSWPRSFCTQTPCIPAGATSAFLPIRSRHLSPSGTSLTQPI